MEKLVYNLYSLLVGIEPSDESFNRTLATANYLKDNGCLITNIPTILKDSVKPLMIINGIKGEDLPDYLWNHSLLEKGKFYYSDLLHIKSKPPTWNPQTFKEECEPFFIEMKIRFTMDDLLIHYYVNCRVPEGIRDEKKDSGAFNHLIKKYNAFNNMPGLDYVLAMINAASKDKDREYMLNVFDLEQYSEDIIKEFASKYEQAVFEKSNLIVWRN